jgi:hypothetical protein
MPHLCAELTASWNAFIVPIDHLAKNVCFPLVQYCTASSISRSSLSLRFRFILLLIMSPNLLQFVYFVHSLVCKIHVNWNGGLEWANQQTSSFLQNRKFCTWCVPVLCCCSSVLVSDPLDQWPYCLVSTVLLSYCLVTNIHPWWRFRFHTGQPCDPDTDWQARACVAVGIASRDVTRRQFGGPRGVSTDVQTVTWKPKLCTISWMSLCTYLLRWEQVPSQKPAIGAYIQLSLLVHCYIIFRFWRWRQYIPSKNLEMFLAYSNENLKSFSFNIIFVKFLKQFLWLQIYKDILFAVFWDMVPCWSC